MTTDFKGKEPTKNEKAIYELYLHQQQTDRNLFSTSLHVLAMGLLLDLKPEQLAELLVTDEEKIKDYGKKVNEAIDKLHTAKHEAAKKPAESTDKQEQKTEESHEGHTH